MADKPLAGDIPTDKAWRAGRRIYIRCGYQSTLNNELRDLGARWDGDVRALWVGSGKADAILPLVRASIDRAAATEAIKAAGRWVKIPYERADLRGRAKELGARWDGERKAWAMPTPEAHAEIEAALDAAAAAKREQRAADAKRQADAQAAEKSSATADTVLARSGRTPTGDTAHVRLVSTRRMRRAGAEAMAYQVGQVIRLDDGRRGVVTAVTVWFTNDDMASSTCWHPETHDEAHWDMAHEVAIVEPTDDERVADAAQDARAADERELDAVFAVAGRDGERTEEWSPVTGPTISRRHDDGHGGVAQIVLDGDRILWQHPGFYDDYRRVERAHTDPALVARVRALVERGARTVGPFTITEV